MLRYLTPYRSQFLVLSWHLPKERKHAKQKRALPIDNTWREEEEVTCGGGDGGGGGGCSSNSNTTTFIIQLRPQKYRQNYE